MKWQKLGRIFDPTEHELSDGCTEFAQYPQPLLFDDFVRIYFSARRRDPQDDTCWLSHVCFVDMDRAFRSILRVSAHTVIELGGLGCFDEHGIFPMNVVRIGGRIFGYTCGISRRVSVPADASIGLAVSDDNGLTFSRLGAGPVLTASLHEPFLMADPFVSRFEEQYHMWYVYGVQWKQYAAGIPPDRIYKIGHAVSDDGVSWRKEGRQLLPDTFEDESQAFPSVARFGRRYHMMFCYRQSFDFRTNRDRSYRIGYAYSDDLWHWTRDDANVGLDVSEGDWDSDMVCYPCIFEMDGQIYVLYNGNEFGRYGFGLARLVDPE